MKKYFYWIEAFFTIVGTVIGLGIFAVPYASKNLGVTPGVLLILGVAVLMTVLNILFAKIIVFNRKDECIVGYAGRYLGKWAQRIESFSVFFGYGGSLVAYMLAVVVFVQSVFFLNEAFFWPIILIFTAINSVVLLNGFRGFGRIELFLSLIMCLMFFAISSTSFPYWKGVPENWENILMPYGVVLFSLTGLSSIPIATKILGENKKKITEVIVFAYIFIAIVTVLFFVAATRTGGVDIGPDPFIAMGKIMGPWVLWLGSILGLLTVVTSQWAISVYLKKILISDIKLKPVLGWFLVVFVPLVLILVGASSFVHIIGLVGIVAGTTDSLIIITIYNKIFYKRGKNPQVLPWKISNGLIWALYILLIAAAMSSIIGF